ncbi:hypothetical protein N9C63_00425 [bacterium]|nr:hypothetical protein [bacterium]
MAYTTINKGSDYFNTKLYTGDGTNPRAITGVGFQPDFVWNKPRSAANSHALLDSVRGATKFLSSDVTDAEYTYGHSIQSFDSDGFTCGDNASFNQNGTTYASWNWKADGTASSNTDGSITSSVSTSTTSGFSIVSYTGTGSAATIGHGLSSAPAMIIVKRRSNTGEWIVYSSVLGSGNGLKLNTTGASFAADATVWNSTNPTSSVFSIGSAVDLNASGNTHIAYCFAEKKGFSKFGSYTGNGSTDGAFVYTGFKPAWVVIKRSSAVSDWHALDNKRAGFNGDNDYLKLNQLDTEGTAGDRVDFLSNGFKLRHATGNLNESGNTFIYMAFAEHPFVSSSGTPTTAR